MRKHEARYAAVIQRITPRKVAAAIIRSRTNDEGVVETYKLTTLEAVKHVLGIRQSDKTHDTMISKALSS